MSKKILITGANGFIGSSLCQYFASKQFDVIACVTTHDTTHKAICSHLIRLPTPDFQQLLADTQPDYLIHCAGGASVSASFQNQQSDFENSVVVTEQLLAAVAAASPLTKVVFLSSAAVYGEPKHLPITEATPVQPISPYGYHKWLAELICQKYHRIAALDIMVLRIFSVYGPGLKKQLLWDLCQKINAEGSSLTLIGSGQETRDLMYITDLTKIIDRLLYTSHFNAQPINIATNHAVSIEYVSRLLLTAMQSNKTLQLSHQQRHGDPQFWSTKTQLEQLINFKEYISIEQGVTLYSDWFKTCKK